MKLIPAIIVTLFYINSAQASPLTEETLKELHEVSKTKENLDYVITKSKNEMDIAINAMKALREPTETEAAAIEKMRQRMHASIESEIDFKVIEEAYKPMYMNTLTEEEARGIIEFNKSPAGATIIKKMPLITEFMTNIMREKMQSITIKTIAIQADFQREIQEVKENDVNRKL